MKKPGRLIVLILSSALMLAACTPVQPGGASRAPAGQTSIPAAFQPAEELEPEVSQALSFFSSDLFKRVAAENTGENVFISPLAAWLPLCMAYNGASGSTAECMANVLHISGVSVEDLNKGNAGLLGILVSADTGVLTAAVDSIWLSKAYENEIKKSFLNTGKQYYNAKIQTLDLGPGAAGTINAWVEQNTGGKIADMIGTDTLNTDMVMLLINAVYFEAPWQHPFNPEWTRPGKFTLLDGGSANVKYMVGVEGEVKNGYTGSDMCVVRLPYGTGRLEMAAVMPREEPFDEFVQGLTADSINTYLGMCGETDLELKFPKFKVEFQEDLRGALTHAGMGEAFGSGAKFGKMSDVGAQISGVLHKAGIDVDETGTKAWSAGSVDMVAATAPPEKLEFDHPFVYLIRDTKTGVILFIGTMVNPA